MGLEFTRQLLAQGGSVVAGVRRPEDATELRDLGERLTILPLDVADSGSVEAFAQATTESFDGLDLLINNAGVPHCGKWPLSEELGSMDAEHVLSVIHTNAVGPLILTQSLVPLLKKGDRPVVASLSSVFSSNELTNEFYANNFGYSASKACVNLFMRHLGVLLAKDGILTVSLDPGWVRTDMGGPTADLSPEEAVTGMLRVVASLNATNSGHYLSYTGEPVPY